MWCILRHWGVQLRLAYSWARPAIFAADKGSSGMFFIMIGLYGFIGSFMFAYVPKMLLIHLYLAKYQLSIDYMAMI